MKKFFLLWMLVFAQLPLLAQVDSLVVKTDSSAVRHQVLLQT